MPRALDGITVIDFSDSMAGAMCSMFLCDNGARVIQIQTNTGVVCQDGDGRMVWDRGKESVLLDLSNGVHSKDVRILYNLIKGADVIVETAPPSSELGDLLESSKLPSLNPHLIHCSITAYGRTGPLRNETLDDDLVMARTGILNNQPGLRPGPSHVIHPVPSVGAALLASQGIVSALYAREDDGRGRYMEISLMSGALMFSPKVIGEVFAENPKQSNPGGDEPFYSIFECSDGVWIQLGCVRKGMIDAAAKVMGITHELQHLEFGSNLRNLDPPQREHIYEIVRTALRMKPAAEWARLFEKADVPYALGRTIDEALDDPQVLFNKMLIDLNDPLLGQVSQMGVPIQMSATPGFVRSARPVLGEHTTKISSEFSNLYESTPVAKPSCSDIMSPPLAGVKVLEMTNLIAGPAAGKLLADLGADVVKLEPPQGDISRGLGRSYFVHLNNNKRSVCLNTRTDEGKEIVQNIAAQSDILLANLRPGATERMGIGSDALERINPNIIETHLTGYGWEGPYSHRPGMDPVATAWMGLQMAQGGGSKKPVFLGQLAVSDFAAGAMGALGAILALFVRRRTGISQRVNTNLLNGGIILSSEHFSRYDSKPNRRLADEGLYGLTALHRLYETADGWIYLAADSVEQWKSFSVVIGDDSIIKNPRYASVEARNQNTKSLSAELTKIFKTKASKQWIKMFKKNKISCAPVTESSQWFFDDPHFIADNSILEQQHPVIGQVKLSHNGIKFKNTSAVYSKPTPLLGEHMRMVLSELGYSEVKIDELYSKEIVKTENEDLMY